MTDTDDFLSEADRALLSREFDIADPLAIENRVAHIPAGAAMPTISFLYDATPSGGMKAGHSPHIPCAFSHGAKHWKGWVVEWPDETRALIGQNCAARHFGLKFRQVENAFNSELNRKNALLRLIEIRRCLPEAIDELEELEKAPPIEAFRLYWRELSRHFGKLSLELSSIHGLQGRLKVTKKIRNRVAEEEQARQFDPELFAKTERDDDPHLRRLAIKRWKNSVEKGPPIWRKEEIDLGPCDAYHLIRGRYKFETLLGEAIAIADKRQASIFDRSSERWNNRDLSENERLLKEMFSKLDAAIGLIEDLKNFTHPANIQRIAIWANELEEAKGEIGHKVRAKGRALINNETGARLECPVLARLKTPHLDALRRTLGLASSRSEAKRSEIALSA